MTTELSYQCKCRSKKINRAERGNPSQPCLHRLAIPGFDVVITIPGQPHPLT